MARTQTFPFIDCALDTTGILVDGKNRQVFVNTEGWDYATVEAVEKNGTTSATWRVKAQRANKYPLASPSDFTSGTYTLLNTTRMTTLLALESQFLVVSCSTADSGKTVDIYVHLRKTTNL